MFESEVNRAIGSKKEISPEVLRSFEEIADGVVSRTLLAFGEHCTECNLPLCYSTCEFYVPRMDGKCSRFIGGMTRIPGIKGFNNYLVKVSFKTGSKLWTLGRLHLFSIKEAKALERRDYLFATLLQLLPLPKFVRTRLIYARYDWKKYMYRRLIPSSELPSYFLLECYNPQNHSIGLCIVLGSTDEEKDKMPFQRQIDIQPGFNRIRIPIAEISKFIDFKRPFSFSIIPNEISNGTVVYFGAWDFVKDIKDNRLKSKICKCVVWDLDNTIWDGILIEDGEDKLRLKSEVVDIITQLDNRGILNSIASKNDPDAVLQVLKKFGIDEYFLYPQISWMPKSEAIRHIAKALNISLDTIIFVDDSEFERAEVLAGCPGVTAIRATEYDSLIKMKECQRELSEESRGRRKRYQEQIVREVAWAGFEGNYFAFLSHTKIELHIRTMQIDDLVRVYELAQRTNQMNFSGNRYGLSELDEILSNRQLDKYVLECKDRFGDYGIIGFSLIDSRGPIMIDLMFSCRVLNKRLEHAFLTYVLKKYIRERNCDFLVRYRKTAKNARVGKVFEDFKFEEIKEEEGLTLLIFYKDQDILDDGIIMISASC